MSFNYFRLNKNELWAFFAPRDHVISHYADAGFPLARISQQPYQGPANAEVMRWVREESRGGSLYPGSFVHVSGVYYTDLEFFVIGSDGTGNKLYPDSVFLSVAFSGPLELVPLCRIRVSFWGTWKVLKNVCKQIDFFKEPLGFVCVDGIFYAKNGCEISLYI